MSDRNNLNYLQRREVDNYLGTVLRKGNDGLVDYLNGESDASVAKRFNCTANNVQYIREMVYGRLRPAVAKFSAEEAVRKLEERIEVLEAVVERLSSRPVTLNNFPVGEQQSLPLKAAE